MEILEYGVCRLSVVPVRAESSDKTEQVTNFFLATTMRSLIRRVTVSG